MSYETDFYAWTQETARAIREGRWAEIDVPHLAEEVEDMGKSEKRALTSRLELILIHLLKLRFQAEKHTASWDLTIKAQRQRVQKLFRENPSLRARLDDLIEDAYSDARLAAAEETGLGEAMFPEVCPFSAEEVLGVSEGGPEASS